VTDPTTLSWVAKAGLVELALGAVLGWAVLVRHERPVWLTRIGIREPHRVLQTHLDLVIMGVLLVAVGLALPALVPWIAVPLVLGTWVNPLLFVQLAFDGGYAARPAYRVVTALSFTATSGSLVAAAVVGVFGPGAS